MKDILEVAAQAAREAGELLMENLGRVQSITTKEDNSHVTEVDQASERMIRTRISEAFPDHAVLGEEEGGSVEGAEYVWVVDPLDGTHNYIAGIPLFGVSIGVIVEGAFAFGAVCMPFQDELYLAESGYGATKNGDAIKVSECGTVPEASLVMDSGFRHMDDGSFGALRNLAPKTFNARVFGCSAGNLTMLAEGRIDLIVEFDDKPWDYAGGVAVLLEAGGCVTDTRGGPFVFGEADYVASNGRIHAATLQSMAVPVLSPV